MQYEIDWHGGDRRKAREYGPRRSHVWTLNGVVVEATTAFKGYIGEPWARVAAACLRRGFTFKAVSIDCVPHTVKYHAGLLANANALLNLLKEPST